MSKKLINLQEITKNVYYELPKQLFYSDEYRTKLSSNAKLLYAIIRDRFNSSIANAKKSLEKNGKLAFVDNNGDVYCIVDNYEIEFTLNITDKTVTKIMKELTDAELIKTVRTSKAKRIYLYTLESDPLDAARFFGKEEYYSYVRAQKKKKLPIETTEEECIAKKINQLMYSYNEKNNSKQNANTSPSKKSAGDSAPQPDGKNPPQPDGNIPTRPGGESTTHIGGNSPTHEAEKIRPNELNSSDPHVSDPNSNEHYSNDSSSKNDSSGIYTKEKELEEDPQQNTSEIQCDFSILENLLNELGLFTLPKDRNVIKKILREANIASLSERVVKYGIVTHKANVITMELEKGHGPKYEPAYFANNLVDRYFELQRNSSIQQEQDAATTNSQDTNNGIQQKVEFYNWLEIRE